MRSRPRLLALVLLALAALICSTWAAADPIVETLPNGLTLIVDEMHTAPLAAVRVYLRTGAIYEQEFTGAGISHFLEHLVGRGSAKRSAEEIEAIQEELGNQTNAYTTTDHTCYHITSAARNVHRMIDLLADYVFTAPLHSDDVEEQRSIILREMAMSEDDPGDRIYELLTTTMFRVHPDRYRVLGYPQSFKQISREDLQTYYNRTYITDNAVVVVVGDLSAPDVLKSLRAAFSDLPRAGRAKPPIPAEPPQIAPRRVEQIAPDLSRAYLAMGYHTVGLLDPDLYPLDVLAYLLTQGASSRLISDLRDARGLVDTISSYSYTPAYGAGRFVVSATLDEANLPATEKAVLEHLDRLASQPVSQTELDRAKKQKEAELVYARSEIENWAGTLGTDYISTGDVDFSRRYVEGIKRVTADDIQRVARQYFTPEDRTIAIRRPGAVDTGSQEAVAASPVPDTTRHTLPNGITVLLRPDHKVPMVTIQASFIGGLRYETPANAGVGQLLAAMLRRGTSTRSRTQIAETLDSRGASLSFSSGRNSLNASATALSADAETVMTLLADCLREPAFPEDELERIRQLALAGIKAQEDDPEHVTMRAMMDKLFGSHPYALDPAGTAQSVQAITRDELIAHYRRVCTPERMVLAIYGDITPDAALALAARLFSDWSLPAGPALNLDMPELPPGENRVAQERPQQQGIIYVGFRGPRVDSDDRFALDVLDAAFSGVYYPGGRLHGRLRGEGLVYFTHMVPSPGLDPGVNMIFAGTEPDKLETVETIIKELVREIQNAPLGDEELRRAKQMCIAAHQVRVGALSDKAQQEALNELYGLGFDEDATYPEDIEAVTAEQVQAAARKYMDLTRCVISVTRPPAAEPK